MASQQSWLCQWNVNPRCAQATSAPSLCLAKAVLLMRGIWHRTSSILFAPDHYAGTTCSAFFLHLHESSIVRLTTGVDSQLALTSYIMSSSFACRGLWRGTSPTILRLTVGVSTQFFALELIKDAFARRRRVGKKGQSLSPWEAFFAGGYIDLFGLCLPAFASVFLLLRRLKYTLVTPEIQFVQSLMMQEASPAQLQPPSPAQLPWSRPAWSTQAPAA